MVTPLHVILDEVIDPERRGIARYAEGLARGLIATRPGGCEVVGFISASGPSESEDIRSRLPGLARLEVSSLSRRQLAGAWQYGFTRPIGTGGMVHAPSLMAPLRRKKVGDQVVVTIHDAVVWTDPDTVDGRTASWYRNMIGRAEKYADAVVVPSHAVAAAVAEHSSLGDRLRVIPGGTSFRAIPDDAHDRADRLSLPERYLVTPASLNPRKSLRELLAAVATVDIPLLVTGKGDWRETELAEVLLAMEIPAGRVRALGELSHDDLTVVDARAAAFVQPSRHEGFGFSTLEAMAIGTPVIVSDDPALVELTDGAALVVDRNGDYSQNLREAIVQVIDDDFVADRLVVAGRDRAKAFTWRDSAEKVWQLHADL